MHLAFLETLQKVGSRLLIGWILQEFWETCDNPIKNKQFGKSHPVINSHSRHKLINVVVAVNFGHICNAFHVYDIFTHLNMMQHKWKRDWLLVPVKWNLGRANESAQRFQNFIMNKNYKCPLNNNSVYANVLKWTIVVVFCEKVWIYRY